jgi:hypothetical protein
MRSVVDYEAFGERQKREIEDGVSGAHAHLLRLRFTTWAPAQAHRPSLAHPLNAPPPESVLEPSVYLGHSLLFGAEDMSCLSGLAGSSGAYF